VTSRTFGARPLSTLGRSSKFIGAFKDLSTRKPKKKKKKPGPGGAKKAEVTVTEGLDVSWAKMMKAGATPEILADSEYPDWIWTLGESKQDTLYQLQRMAANDFDNMTDEQRARLFAMMRIEQIKDKNLDKAN
jgi:hypothetical protein